MAKRISGLKVFGISLAVLLVVLILVVGSYFVFFEQSIQGFTTLSLTKANLRSDSSFLDGEQWIMTIRQGGLGQNAFGCFSPNGEGGCESVADASSSGKTTTNDFEISVEFDKQQCVYPVENAGDFDSVRIYQITKWTYIPFIDPCTKQEAISRGIQDDTVFFVQREGGSLTCSAVHWSEQAVIGNFGRTDLLTEMTVDVDAGSRSGSKRLSSKGSAQGAVSDFAYVVWDGNLDRGQACSYTTDMPFRPAWQQVSGSAGWTVIEKDEYERYLDRHRIIEDKAEDFTYLNDISGSIEDDIDGLNELARRAKVSNSFGSWEQSTSFRNGVLTEEQDSPLQNPVLTLYIKADTVGIYTPAPELKLRGTDSECFATGEEGLISVVAENVGGESGTWNFFGSCDGVFDVTRSREFSIGAGQERTVTLPVSGDATSKTFGECTIFAEGVAGTERISASVCVDPQQSCVPNELYCATSGGSDVVRQCSGNGATSEIKEVCGVGESCVDAECVSEDRVGGGLFSFLRGLFDPLFRLYNNFKVAVSATIGVLSLFVAFSVWRRVEDINRLKNPKWFAWVVGVVVGLAMGYLTYILFGWALLVLVVFLILRVLLGRFGKK